MKIIITMAGEGSRFKKIGIKKQKYELIANGRSLYEWSMLSLVEFFNEQFIFITRIDHNAREFIGAANKTLGISNYSIVEIETLTDGQASTVLKAQSSIDMKEEILIYNIDTYVEPHQVQRNSIQGSGWIPAFYAEGDKWSFVNFDENYKVFQIAEKRRISDYGTIGLYYFKSFELYKEAYYNEDHSNISEKYIAPIYSYLIGKGENVYTSIIEQEKVHVLGTPEDLEAFDPDYLYKNL